MKQQAYDTAQAVAAPQPTTDAQYDPSGGMGNQAMIDEMNASQDNGDGGWDNEGEGSYDWFLTRK